MTSSICSFFVYGEENTYNHVVQSANKVSESWSYINLQINSSNVTNQMWQQLSSCSKSEHFKNVTWRRNGQSEDSKTPNFDEYSKLNQYLVLTKYWFLFYQSMVNCLYYSCLLINHYRTVSIAMRITHGFIEFIYTIFIAITY